MTAPYDPEHVTYFGETNFRNAQTRFGIKSRDRTRHMYVVGKSGVGKSTLLENMAIQDIQNGEGIAVLDPHGSFAEKMLDYIPEDRIKDVIYFAPFDLDNPVSFNMLEDVGPSRRHFVASGLMSTFKKIWVDAWSARMEYILNNILLALLEYPGATLLGVNRMLADKIYRNKVVANISDPSVKAFWTDEFAKYGERYMQEAGAAIQNKIGQFTANPLVRNIIGQSKSSFDIREVMDKQKILIVNLSKGRIGEQNTSLLGSMIITKIYLAAMSRAEVSSARIAELPNFYFYVDEFQSFANETFADILSEARKYKLALIIAHQYIAQMEESVRDAVFGNVGTSVSFRVGPLDAELLEKVYAPQFTANDLINLGMAQIYLSLMINDIGSKPFSAKTLPPIQRPSLSFRNDVIEWSRKTYALPKDSVEKTLAEWFAEDAAPLEEEKPKKFQFEKRDTAPLAKKTFKQSEDKFEKPKQHNPFKKAFETLSENPTLETKEEKVFEKQSTVSKQTVTPSAELSALLGLLDEKKELPQTEEPIRDSLKETLVKQTPPVKLAERGPTEASKNLLKQALQNAGIQNGTKEAASIEEKKREEVKKQPANETGEISHEALQKILE